jgi:hypothetical protein
LGIGRRSNQFHTRAWFGNQVFSHQKQTVVNLPVFFLATDNIRLWTSNNLVGLPPFVGGTSYSIASLPPENSHTVPMLRVVGILAVLPCFTMPKMPIKLIFSAHKNRIGK